MNERLRLLDTTLRDGSYVINFQFTARDTAVIAGLVSGVKRQGFFVGERRTVGWGGRHVWAVLSA